MKKKTESVVEFLVEEVASKSERMFEVVHSSQLAGTRDQRRHRDICLWPYQVCGKISTGKSVGEGWREGGK